MLSSGSCSRCNRPLTAESDGGLCPECLRTAGSAGSTPASAAQHPRTPHTPPAPGGPATLSMGPPRAAPAGHPFAAQFQSTFTEADRTRTPHPDADTGGFEVGARDYLPEAPPGYDLVRPLGSGGWSTVYLAREHAAERTVAVKFLHAPTSQIAFERFLVEARALARLDHPNIVKVITVETNWREPFLTMEYAAGGTLADLNRPGEPPPDPADAARVMVAVAEAVAAAHAAGILHRDLKPSNVLLAVGSGQCSAGSRDDAAAAPPPTAHCPLPTLTPKVSDFGLAKRTDRDDGLTRTAPLGTPSYMSPEAAAGRFRDIGPAADVYGLGATLYHLLTGRPPFTGDSSDEVIRKVLTEHPDRPRAVRPDIPSGLEAVVVKALEKDPAARYATAADMAADLRRFLAGQVPAAPVLSRGRRARRWLGRNRNRIGLIAGAVLLAVGLVAAARLWPSDPPPDPGPNPAPAPDPEQVIRADLAAGKAVTLIGQTGLPKYHRMFLTPGSLGESSLGDRTCEYNNIDAGMLELLPDPGIDRYTVSLELRHLLTRLGPPAGGMETDAVAFYFGHAAAPGGDGATAHALLAVYYRDFQLAGPNGRFRKPTATLQWRGILQSPNGKPKTVATSRGGGLEFEAQPAVQGVRADPGVWRPIEVDVSPEEVHVRWRADDGAMTTLARYPAVAVQARYDQTRRDLDAKAPGAGAALPGWSPRAGLGIIAFRSSVAVRNVKLTPQPTP